MLHQHWADFLLKEGRVGLGLRQRQADDERDEKASHKCGTLRVEELKILCSFGLHETVFGGECRESDGLFAEHAKT